MIGNFPAVLNFNRLFLKLNRFICNQLPVLPDHRTIVVLTRLDCTLQQQIQVQPWERFSDSVDGGDVESGILVDTTVTDGQESGWLGRRRIQRLGWELPRSHAENEIFGNPYLGRLSLAQGVRLKGTRGRASDRHSRSERAFARLDRRTDGGREGRSEGCRGHFSRFLTHPLPKSFFFLSFTRFGLVFNKIRCPLYLLPSLRCDLFHHF